MTPWELTFVQNWEMQLSKESDKKMIWGICVIIVTYFQK